MHISGQELFLSKGVIHLLYLMLNLQVIQAGSILNHTCIGTAMFNDVQSQVMQEPDKE